MIGPSITRPHGTPEPEQTSLLDWPQREGASHEVLSELAVLSRRRARRKGALAATLGALAVVTVLIFWRDLLGSKADLAPTGTSVVVAPMHETLPDGTVVEWKDEAVRHLNFTEAARRVTQRQGTAHYDVYPDPNRPFIVVVGGLEVRALGTKFAIEVDASGVEVIVTEGKVEARLATAGTRAEDVAATAVMSPGDRLLVGAAELAEQRINQSVVALDEQELNRRTTWRTPRLIFRGTPLWEVVATFNRSNRQDPHSRRLILADPSLRDVQISGVLRADNITALIHLLKEDHGVVSSPRGDHDIVLDRSE